MMERPSRTLKVKRVRNNVYSEILSKETGYVCKNKQKLLYSTNPLFGWLVLVYSEYISKTFYISERSGINHIILEN